MRLDNRLVTVAALVPRNARVADVGTDHAYLAIALLNERDAKLVIATDKNEGPCAAARRTLSTTGLSERVSVRCGDGLSPLLPEEVNTVCIAGMGGGLITSILTEGIEVLSDVSRLVLQPMNDAEKLRRWLYENSWHIVEESLAMAEARLYEIIAAEPGAEEAPEQWLLTLGPILWKDRPPFFAYHVESQVGRLRHILRGMEKSNSARRSEAYRKITEILQNIEQRWYNEERRTS